MGWIITTTTTPANATATTTPANAAVTTAIATPTDTTATTSTTVPFTAVTTTTAANATIPTPITDTIDEENPFVESLAYDLFASPGAHLLMLSLHSSSDSHSSWDTLAEVMVACPKACKEAQDVKTFFLRENVSQTALLT